MSIRHTLQVIRETLTGVGRLRVRPKVFVGYDAESEAKWQERFGYSRRLPDLAVFRAALDPAVLASDEAEAETVVRLAYSWGSAAAFGRRASSGIVQAVALCCEVTIWSRAEQRVVERRLFAGAPPPESVLSTPRQCKDEVFGEMPPVGQIVGFLRNLKVE